MWWIDEGIRIAQEHGWDLPLLGTVAVSDSALRLEPSENALLDALVDQLSARTELSGVYLVIEQSQESGYYCAQKNSVGAALKLCRGFKLGGLGRVVVSCFGWSGFLCLAAGAETWIVGWYRGERRVKVADLTDDTGMATPTYYSHALASEIHLGDDLDRVVDAGSFESVVDSTPASEGLVRALRRRRRSSSVAEWESRKSNVRAAREHFLFAALRETAKLGGGGQEVEGERIEAWLAKSTELARGLRQMTGWHPRTELGHQSAWADAFRQYGVGRVGK
jgi:hypothetical protein